MVKKYLITVLLVLSITAISCYAEADSEADSVPVVISGPYLGQTAPGSEPELFAPGILPVDGVQHCYPAFSPDGLEVYWMKVDMSGERPRGEIWFMEEKDGAWTNPALASFSGEFNDHAPVFSHDGGRIYFSSVRPGGVSRGKNLWYVERNDTGWSEPVLFSSPPNSEIGLSQATFTREGAIYFVGRFEGAQWSAGIYRSYPVDDVYGKLELLNDKINTSAADVYPFIAPDESFLLFASTRPGAKSTETDLYISIRKGKTEWADPIQLGPEINNGRTVSFACLSPNCKYLFFNRFDEDGTDKFYWVDASILEPYINGEDN